MEKLELKVTGLEKTISTLLRNIEEMNHSMKAGFEMLRNEIGGLRNEIGALRGTVDKHGTNIDTLRNDIGALRGNSTSSIETLELRLDDLTAEVKKINDVSGYNDIYANNKGLTIVNKK